MSDPVYPSIPYEGHLGEIRNKSEVFNAGALPVKADIKLTKGMIVDILKATGVEPAVGTLVPSSIAAIEFDSDNSGGTKGAKIVEVWGKGTIITIKAGAAIDAATTRALQVTATAGDAGTLIPLTVTEANNHLWVATYLGHTNEYGGVGLEPTDAAKGDEIVVELQ